MFVLAQLSDPHIGATWADADPVAGLRAGVEAVRALPRRPDALLVSGDLAEHGADEEYALARELLQQAGVPLYVLPGNHDDRAALRRHFDVPGADAEDIHYAADLGPMRLVVLDSTRPGADDGALGAEQLEWLEAELAVRPELPALVALHHPPLLTGVAEWDDFALAADDRGALADVVGRNPQVRRIVAGHLHRAMVSDTVLVAPSTYAQLRAGATDHELDLTHEPAGFATHTVVGAEVVSALHAYVPRQLPPVA